MKNVENSAALIACIGIPCEDYLKLVLVSWYSLLWQLLWLYCCFSFLLPETEAHNSCIMELQYVV
jgi:hypothetical protein